MFTYRTQSEESNRRRRETYSLTGGIVKKRGHDAEKAFADAFLGTLITVEKNNFGDRRKEDVVTDQFGRCSVKKGDKIQMLHQVFYKLAQRFGDEHIVVRYGKDIYEFKQNKNDITYTMGLSVAHEFKHWLECKYNFTELLHYVLGGYNEVDYIVDMIDTSNEVAFISPIEDVVQSISNLVIDIRVTSNLSVVSDIIDKKGALSFEIRKAGVLFKMFGRAILGKIRLHPFCKEVKLS